MSNLVYAGTGHVFPEVVRGFNMLRPSRWNYSTELGGTLGTNVRSWDNADYFKDWLPYNLQLSSGADVDTVTLDALVTAPDGTNTGRLIKENTGNSEHAILAGTQGTGAQVPFGKLRFAGVFKYAGRRIVMEIVNGKQAATPTLGCRALFDLYNGSIVMDTTTFGAAPTHPWIIYPAEMRAVGNGWYLCQIEAQPHLNTAMPTAVFCKVSLDNGVGSAALSITYTGNGSSGVYGWRSNLLPSRAWNLNTVTLFDDFETTDTIDLQDTRAPGFNWYPYHDMPGWDFGSLSPALEFLQHPTAPECFSCTDSVLTVHGSISTAMGSVASLWNGPAYGVADREYTYGWVGTTFQRPALYETRHKFDFELASTGQSVVGATWTRSLEHLLIGRHALPKPDDLGSEMDFAEIQEQSLAGLNLHLWGVGDIPHYAAGSGDAWWSNIPKWASTSGYTVSNFKHAGYMGTPYTCILNHAGFPGHLPDEPGSLYWGPYVSPDASTQRPIVDWNEFHTISTMVFPYIAPDQPGQIYGFFNGGLAHYSTYAPDMPGITGTGQKNMHLTDSQQDILYLGGGSPTLDHLVDWIKVTN